MKMICIFCLILLGAAFAQTNPPPAFDPGTAALPQTKEAMWLYAISILTPLCVWGISKIPKLPRPVLPTIAPVIGLGIGVVLNKINAMHLPWWEPTLAGGFGVAVREMFNQLVTKQMKPGEESKTDAKPVDNAVAIVPSDPKPPISGL